MTPTQTMTFETLARRIAARQHGVVSRQQLLDADIGPDVIDHRVRVGRVECLHRGVYLVGPVVPPYAHLMAACLACGPGAVLSHRSAAELWRIRSKPWTGPVEVTLTAGIRRRPGVHAYRIATLSASETTRHDGIPVTTPARTILDLAAVLPTKRVERAAAEVIALRLASLRQLEAVAARHEGRPGASRLRAALGNGAGPLRTRSAAEERFLRLIRRGEIRTPEVNVVVDGFEVDFFWRREGIVVEIDGLTYHRSPYASDRDRRRDAVLAARGIFVTRVTCRQLVDEPEAVLVRLASTLALAGSGADRD